MNGEGSVPVDRGNWLYRFEIDAGAIAIYRSRRAGQDLVEPEVWRCLANLSVSDAFVLRGDEGWRPFIELADGREQWALAARPTREEAEQAARHFLETLAIALSQSGRDREASLPLTRTVPEIVNERPEVDAALAEARSRRDHAGWELVFSRQREYR